MKVLQGAMRAVSSVFGCQHGRLSRPFTIQQQSYMVCLDCGHKQFYSMQEMRRLSRKEIKRLLAIEAGALHLSAAAAEASLRSDGPSLAA
ncbi:hypothetical protein [Acidipila sp. EB88]|uniref:hypothetical protein n=1 Tax=Acidipila sp. EB88 TaxID=2305226 RepID=UPI000F5FBE21|nr:hypothetical protein [Acidipila sp. EB88]RRA48782.1 hypothetical protein D1Y84_11295 [Acidipila sp. EB88]